MRNWNHVLERKLGRRRRPRRFKNEFIFYLRILEYSSFTLFITVKALAKLNLGHLNKFETEFLKLAVVLHVLQTTQNWSFHVVVLPSTAKKCTKIYNAHAQLLFSSLNRLFSDVSVVIAVVVIFNSPMADRFPELPSSD